MTDIKLWRSRLLQEIKQADLLRQTREIELPSGAPGLVGLLDVEGRAVELLLDIGPLWENRLPVFFLRPRDALGFIPHIDPDGVICFLENEGLILDRRRPLEVVRECLVQVHRTLHQGITGTNWHDFVDEFEIYWAWLPDPILAIANIELSAPESVAEIFVGIGSRTEAGLYITHDAALLPHIPAYGSEFGPWRTCRALYLPLEPGTRLLPPQSEPPFWGADGVQRLLSYCSPENRARLETLLQKRSFTHEYLIIRLPRPSGDAVLFGIHFQTLNELHPLANREKASSIKPIVILRQDKHYLVQRGGGQVALSEKKVLLLGCGAVGGNLAFELSRAGVEHLHLVDPDVLEPENTYRHILGKRHWSSGKAIALKQSLRAQLPFSKAKSFTCTIEKLIASNKVALFSYDLIISAIGNPTSELALNEFVRKKGGGPPIIFTWVEPYGIGGHAVLTGLSDMPGCFECLYAQSNPGEHLHNRASFAAPGQVFRRSIAGCRNLYTPYGSLDAAQTAQLATRLAIETLTGRAQKNRICSWKGDSATFVAEGFKVSERYKLSLDRLEQLETSFASDVCPVCRSSEDKPGI